MQAVSCNEFGASLQWLTQRIGVESASASIGPSRIDFGRLRARSCHVLASIVGWPNLFRRNHLPNTSHFLSVNLNVVSGQGEGRFDRFAV